MGKLGHNVETLKAYIFVNTKRKGLKVQQLIFSWGVFPGAPPEIYKETERKHQNRLFQSKISFPTLQSTVRRRSAASRKVNDDNSANRLVQSIIPPVSQSILFEWFERNFWLITSIISVHDKAFRLSEHSFSAARPNPTRFPRFSGYNHQKNYFRGVTSLEIFELWLPPYGQGVSLNIWISDSRNGPLDKERIQAFGYIFSHWNFTRNTIFTTNSTESISWQRYSIFFGAFLILKKNILYSS